MVIGGHYLSYLIKIEALVSEMVNYYILVGPLQMEIAVK